MSQLGGDEANYPPKPCFVDIGANLLDERFTEGKYNGKVRHEPDWEDVLSRAQSNGVTHIILTAGTLRESRRALDLVRELTEKNQTCSTNIHFGCTIGVHPTRCTQEFVQSESPEEVLAELVSLAVDGQTDKAVVAIGEIGLDYDRLEFCSKEIQLEYLTKQLDAFLPTPTKDKDDRGELLRHLPLFLHNRSVGPDLLTALKAKQQQLKDAASATGTAATTLRGVVHSFDDSIELAQQFIDCGFYIGLNGCSLKTKENLQVVKQLPLESILLETDCPYCEIKQTHAGFEFIKTKFDKKADKKFVKGIMVKGRNEPCQMIQVAEVIAGVKEISVQQVADQCYQNSLDLYGWSSTLSS